MTNTPSLYQSLNEASAASSSTLMREISYVVDAARVNADDTVYVEKSANDWDVMFKASLECALAYHKDRKVIMWFKRRGISV